MTLRKFRLPLAIVAGVLAANSAAALFQVVKEYKSGVVWPTPKVVTPGDRPGDPPSDAVVLFDGKDMTQWKGGENWEVKDGYVITRKTGVTSKQSFGDMQLHIEFATPEKVSGSGQGRGNSGVYIMGNYELQILDSWQNPTYVDGSCGSIYKQSPPMVNASRKPGEWQSYDVVFEAPKFAADGTVAKPAFMTVFQNGVLVQNHFALTGHTYYDRPPAYAKHADKLPISLQFHGNEVKFRNIWVREIKQLQGKPPAPKK